MTVVTSETMVADRFSNSASSTPAPEKSPSVARRVRFTILSTMGPL